MKVDAIVVGQGLAGTLLSYFLWVENKNFIVVDLPHAKSASIHSSGVVNPITGKRFVKSWLVDELLPCALETYNDIEELLDKTLVHRQHVKRIIHSIEEINDLSVIKNSPEYLPYLCKIENSQLDTNLYNNPFGYCEISESFRLDVKSMLQAFRLFLMDKSALLEESFDYSQFNVIESKYKDIKFDKIVFCQGYQNTENPYFKNLPVIPNKGQYLIISNEKLNIESTITGAGIISPLDNQTLYAGATYEWSFENDFPTEVALKQLKSNASSLIKGEYEVLSHKAGIRPTSTDRRPIIGTHPEFKNLAILNGFGAKGTSLAPYFALQLYNHLWKAEKLNIEVALARFNK